MSPEVLKPKMGVTIQDIQNMFIIFDSIIERFFHVSIISINV